MAIGSVSLTGLHVEDTIFTWFISGGATKADVGKAVSQNTGAARTVKLALDGEVIVGWLQTVENRVTEGVNVCAVELHGGTTLSYTGTLPTLGQSVVGSATPGVVKAAAANGRNLIVAVDATAGTVEVLFF